MMDIIPFAGPCGSKDQAMLVKSGMATLRGILYEYKVHFLTFCPILITNDRLARRWQYP